MPQVLDAGLLDKLDILIEHYGLHDGDPLLPVILDVMLEAYVEGYKPLPPRIEAVTARWRKLDEEFKTIAYNVRLKEPKESARRRHAGAHEFAHLFCRHRGERFVMYWSDPPSSGFDRFVGKGQERQCDHVAAYLLVPLGALREMEGADTWQVARTLDVPERLVEVRWEIWRKWGR